MKLNDIQLHIAEVEIFEDSTFIFKSYEIEVRAGGAWRRWLVVTIGCYKHEIVPLTIGISESGDLPAFFKNSFNQYDKF